MKRSGEDMPSFAAVEAVLSQLEAGETTPFTPEVMRCFAEIFRSATGHDPEQALNADLVVKIALLSFWAGFRAANAQRDENELKVLIKQD